jgi:hypothetical protein
MFDDSNGPVEHFEWAAFTIRGQKHSANGVGVGKDIWLVGESVSAWDARKGHVLTPAMVQCALDQNLDVLVIGTGVNGAIRLKDRTRKAVKEAGIQELIVAKTPEACDTFNRLFREGRRVGLLAHGTC